MCLGLLDYESVCYWKIWEKRRSFKEIFSKWIVSSCVLSSKSCPSSLCLFINILYSLCVSGILRYWSFFLILSYSYLTLPEKQSSSAVTWASPGCHVFLKGCVRGTPSLQISSLSIMCPMHLCILFFHELCSDIPHSGICFDFLAFIAILSCHIFFIHSSL